jgi:hypothetical protein
MASCKKDVLNSSLKSVTNSSEKPPNWVDPADLDLFDPAVVSLTPKIYSTFKALYGFGNGNDKARLVVDGVITNLTNGTTFAEANDVFVDDANNVFVTGVENGQARVWKNGALYQSLPSNYGQYSVGSSIVVSPNGDVHVVGFTATGPAYTFFSPTTLNPKAAYWKNGVQMNLQDGYGSQELSKAFYIEVKNNNVYIVGINTLMHDKCVWLNGILTPSLAGPLPAPTYPLTVDFPKGIKVDNSGNVYVLFDNKLFKNGVLVNSPVPAAPSGSNGYSKTYTSICSSTDGNDIYVSGQCSAYAPPVFFGNQGQSFTKNIIWKNGINLAYNANYCEKIFALDNDMYSAVAGLGTGYFKNGTMLFSTSCTVTGGGNPLITGLFVK